MTMVLLNLVNATNGTLSSHWYTGIAPCWVRIHQPTLSNTGSSSGASSAPSMNIKVYTLFWMRTKYSMMKTRYHNKLSFGIKPKRIPHANAWAICDGWVFELTASNTSSPIVFIEANYSILCGFMLLFGT